MPPKRKSNLQESCTIKKFCRVSEDPPTCIIPNAEEREVLSQRHLASTYAEDTTESDTETDADNNIELSEQRFPLISFVPSTGSFEFHMPNIIEAASDFGMMISSHFEGALNPFFSVNTIPTEVIAQIFQKGFPNTEQLKEEESKKEN